MRYQHSVEIHERIENVLHLIETGILEPHSISLADASAKAAGMAKFAAKHFDAFRRTELFLLDGKRKKRLDLANEIGRNKVKAVSNVEHLRSVMD